jgi:sensor domain CHASE-containing protein
MKPNINSFARHGMQVSWKTLLFWGILILAVAVLVGVAIRLMGQMKVSKS